MAENTTAHQQEFNLREYWQILVRRRWLIYTFVLVATVVTAVVSFVATPVYRATTTIAIERSGVRLLRQDLVSSEPSWLDYQNFYNTQYRIIESDTVLRKAVDQLGLLDPGKEIPGVSRKSALPSLADFKNQVLRSLSLAGARLPDPDKYYEHVKYLRGGLSVEPVRDSHLVNISFVSPEPAFAAQAANAIADAYKDFTLGSKLDLARQSQKFFLEQVESLRKEITQEEENLQQFARLKGIMRGDTEDAAIKNYDELRTRLTVAQADLAAAKARFSAYTNAPADSIDEVRNSPFIQQLKQEAARLEQEYRTKVATYGTQYPEVLKLGASLETAKENLRRETDKMSEQAIRSVRVDYSNKANAVAELQRLFDSIRAGVEQQQGPMNEYLTRKKIVETKRTTLNELLQKQNDMQLSASLSGEGTGHNVRIIDQAQAPRQIFKPKKKLNIALGFLFGLFLGVGFAVLMEYVDNTLKTPDDVRNVLGLAVLGMIPAQEDRPRDQRARKKKQTRDETRIAAAAARDIDPALVTLQSPLSPIAEAYRELRTAVLLATPGHPPRDLTVTSCQPSEGKTTTAINLAIALAQLGRRILVVDTDLRRPRCHQVLRTSATRGVSTYLTGNSDLKTLILPTSAERVWLLPAGPIPPNPAELLDAERFRELLLELRASGDWDHVIFDSPPVLSVVDPLLIGRHTEGTVLVLKSAFTSRESGRLGKEKLLSGRVNLLGVLLNAVATEHVPYQYRYYRYGYARKEGEEAAPPAGADAAETGAGSGRRA